MHPLVTLAANATRGSRRYVLFAGAGLSKDAGLPTAWQLMLKTAQLIRAKHEGDATSDDDIQTWFCNSPYAGMRYDELIGGLYPTSAAQQAFLRDELKSSEPGKAHRLVAELAREGVLRCVITTNFDDMIEVALRERGLEYQVITEENLDTSEPLIQCPVFRVYKPHGTIGAGRLRNTPADLEELTPNMAQELASVIGDHGLIALGYSGSDEGIRRVFRQKRRHIYPTFWVHLGEAPPTLEPSLFGNEPLHFVPSAGASSFLDELLGMYRKLDLMAPTGGLGIAAQAAEDAVRGEKRDARAKVRRFWEGLAGEIDKIAPDLSRNPDDELFVRGLDQSLPAATHFARVSAAIAEMGDNASACELHKGFEHLLKGYYLPRGVGGHFINCQFDFYKFIGHELFVLMFSQLVQEDRWELIAQLLDQGIYMDNPQDGNPRMGSFLDINHSISILEHRSQRLKTSQFEHFQILTRRHTEGELAQLAPAKPFAETDLLLYLRSIADMTRSGTMWPKRWWPWSALGTSEVPRYLLEATRNKGRAEQLRLALRVPDIGQLREVLSVSSQRLSEFKGSNGFIDWAHALSYFNPQVLAGD